MQRKDWPKSKKKQLRDGKRACIPGVLCERNTEGAGYKLSVHHAVGRTMGHVCVGQMGRQRNTGDARVNRVACIQQVIP